MIFTIQTNDEVSGLAITNLLNFAHIEHTILSKQHDDADAQSRQAIIDLLDEAIVKIGLYPNGYTVAGKIDMLVKKATEQGKIGNKPDFIIFDELPDQM